MNKQNYFHSTTTKQNKKERLAKTSYYDNEFKLKEYYTKFCRNLNCYGCVLFTVKEIVFDTPTDGTGEQAPKSVSFKKVKRLLAIRPNKISLIDHKTKSWFSGDGYYNLTPVFLLNPSLQTHEQQQQQSADNMPHTHHGQQQSFINNSLANQLANFFRLGSSTIDMDKLFVIEFRGCKWHLQIDNFHSLKSITCILLDQSLDMGIDSNPLMLDLTISEHYQNRYKLLAPTSHASNNNNGNNLGNQAAAAVANGADNKNQQMSHVSTMHLKKKAPHPSAISNMSQTAAKKSAGSNTNSGSNPRSKTAFDSLLCTV